MGCPTSIVMMPAPTRTPRYALTPETHTTISCLPSLVPEPSSVNSPPCYCQGHCHPKILAALNEQVRYCAILCDATSTYCGSVSTNA
jgi:hypothetical protein